MKRLSTSRCKAFRTGVNKVAINATVMMIAASEDCPVALTKMRWRVPVNAA